MKQVNTLIVIGLMFFTAMAYAGPKDEGEHRDRGEQDAVSIRADWMAVADAVALTGQENKAGDLRAAIEAMTDEELYLGYGDLNIVGLAEAFVNTATAFDAVEDMYAKKGYAKTKSAYEAYIEKDSGGPTLSSSGLPPAEGYPGGACPFSPGRSNADELLIAVDVIAAAGVALEIAEGVWSLTDRACGLVIVGIGAVGNPQTAICIAADIVLFAAKAVLNAARAVVDHIAFCDGAVDSAEIEGAYERAGHIHTDLTDHNTNIDTDLAAHDLNIDTDLAAHDLNIDTDLITHDTDIKLLLANLQGTVDENQRLIKITMSRQQEIIRLLMTPSGRRVVNEDVLTCTGLGDDCPVYPVLQLCENGSLAWNCDE